MNWTDYEERYGEGREDFTDEEETSWEQEMGLLLSTPNTKRAAKAERRTAIQK